MERMGSDERQTTNGLVRGSVHDGVHKFLGIRLLWEGVV
jgi:hypothetical protein